MAEMGIVTLDAGRQVLADIDAIIPPFEKEKGEFKSRRKYLPHIVVDVETKTLVQEISILANSISKGSKADEGVILKVAAVRQLKLMKAQLRAVARGGSVRQEEE